MVWPASSTPGLLGRPTLKLTPQLSGCDQQEDKQIRPRKQLVSLSDTTNSAFPQLRLAPFAALPRAQDASHRDRDLSTNPICTSDGTRRDAKQTRSHRSSSVPATVSDSRSALLSTYLQIALTRLPLLP